MAGKRWSEEELQILDDMSGVFLTASIAKRLGRSYSAVALKINRTGRTGFAGSTDMLSINQVHQIMGVESRKIKRWQRNGLRIVNKGKYKMIRQEELVAFLKKHPDDWNAADVEDDAIFAGASWYQAKRKADAPSRYFWTEAEASRLKALYYNDIPLAEIARRMGRSESSIKYKLYVGGIVNGGVKGADPRV